MKLPTLLFILVTGAIAVSGDVSTVKVDTKYYARDFMTERISNFHRFTAIVSDGRINATDSEYWIYEHYVKEPLNGTMFVIRCEPDDIPTEKESTKRALAGHVCSNEYSTVFFVKKYTLKPDDDSYTVLIELYDKGMYVTGNFTAKTVVMTMKDSFGNVNNTLPADFNPLTDKLLLSTLKRQANINEPEPLLPSATTSITDSAYDLYYLILRGIRLINIVSLLLATVSFGIVVYWIWCIYKSEISKYASVPTDEDTKVKYLKDYMFAKLKTDLKKCRQDEELIEDEQSNLIAVVQDYLKNHRCTHKLKTDLELRVLLDLKIGEESGQK